MCAFHNSKLIQRFAGKPNQHAEIGCMYSCGRVLVGFRAKDEIICNLHVGCRAAFLVEGMHLFIFKGYILWQSAFMPFLRKAVEVRFTLRVVQGSSLQGQWRYGCKLFNFLESVRCFYRPWVKRICGWRNYPSKGDVACP